MQSTSDKELIKSLEGLRGIAALVVALYHLKIGATYVPMIKHGYLFVDLFFVLSGFVISSAYWTRLSSQREVVGFLIRRLGRLFPLLAVTTILYVAAENAVVGAKWVLVWTGKGTVLNSPEHLVYAIPTIWEVVTTATLTHGMALHQSLILNYVSWSISVEFWAYVLFAALCMLLPEGKRLRMFIPLSLMMFAITVNASLGEYQCTAKGGCLNVAHDFGFTRCVGSFMLGAIVWKVRHVGRGAAANIQLVSVAAVLALFALLDRYPAAAFGFPVVYSVAIWALASDTGPLARILSNRYFVELGKRSYGVYMIHPILLFAFIQAAQRVSGFWTGALTIAAYVGVLYLISGLSYRLIEQPARQFFNSVARRFDQRHPAASSDAILAVPGRSYSSDSGDDPKGVGP